MPNNKTEKTCRHAGVYSPRPSNSSSPIIDLVSSSLPFHTHMFKTLQEVVVAIK